MQTQIWRQQTSTMVFPDSLAAEKASTATRGAVHVQVWTGRAEDGSDVPAGSPFTPTA